MLPSVDYAHSIGYVGFVGLITVNGFIKCVYFQVSLDYQIKTKKIIYY